MRVCKRFIFYISFLISCVCIHAAPYSNLQETTLGPNPTLREVHNFVPPADPQEKNNTHAKENANDVATKLLSDNELLLHHSQYPISRFSSKSKNDSDKHVEKKNTLTYKSKQQSDLLRMLLRLLLEEDLKNTDNVHKFDRSKHCGDSQHDDLSRVLPQHTKTELVGAKRNKRHSQEGLETGDLKNHDHTTLSDHSETVMSRSELTRAAKQTRDSQESAETGDVDFQHNDDLSRDLPHHRETVISRSAGAEENTRDSQKSLETRAYDSQHDADLSKALPHVSKTVKTPCKCSTAGKNKRNGHEYSRKTVAYDSEQESRILPHHTEAVKLRAGSKEVEENTRDAKVDDSELEDDLSRTLPHVSETIELYDSEHESRVLPQIPETVISRGASTGADIHRRKSQSSEKTHATVYDSHNKDILVRALSHLADISRREPKEAEEDSEYSHESVETRDAVVYDSQDEDDLPRILSSKLEEVQEKSEDSDDYLEDNHDLPLILPRHARTVVSRFLLQKEQENMESLESGETNAESDDDLPRILPQHPETVISTRCGRTQEGDHPKNSYKHVDVEHVESHYSKHDEHAPRALYNLIENVQGNTEDSRKQDAVEYKSQQGDADNSRKNIKTKDAVENNLQYDDGIFSALSSIFEEVPENIEYSRKNADLKTVVGNIPQPSDGLLRSLSSLFEEVSENTDDSNKSVATKDVIVNDLQQNDGLFRFLSSLLEETTDKIEDSHKNAETKEAVGNDSQHGGGIFKTLRSLFYDVPENARDLNKTAKIDDAVGNNSKQDDALLRSFRSKFAETSGNREDAHENTGIEDAVGNNSDEGDDLFRSLTSLFEETQTKRENSHKNAEIDDANDSEHVDSLFRSLSSLFEETGNTDKSVESKHTGANDSQHRDGLFRSLSSLFEDTEENTKNLHKNAATNDAGASDSEYSHGLFRSLSSLFDDASGNTENTDKNLESKDANGNDSQYRGGLFTSLSSLFGDAPENTENSNKNAEIDDAVSNDSEDSDGLFRSLTFLFGETSRNTENPNENAETDDSVLRSPSSIFVGEQRKAEDLHQAAVDRSIENEDLSTILPRDPETMLKLSLFEEEVTNRDDSEKSIENRDTYDSQPDDDLPRSLSRDAEPMESRFLLEEELENRKYSHNSFENENTYDSHDGDLFRTLPRHLNLKRAQKNKSHSDKNHATEDSRSEGISKKPKELNTYKQTEDSLPYVMRTLHNKPSKGGERRVADDSGNISNESFETSADTRSMRDPEQIRRNSHEDHEHFLNLQRHFNSKDRQQESLNLPSLPKQAHKKSVESRLYTDRVDYSSQQDPLNLNLVSPIPVSIQTRYSRFPPYIYQENLLAEDLSDQDNNFFSNQYRHSQINDIVSWDPAILDSIIEDRVATIRRFTYEWNRLVEDLTTFLLSFQTKKNMFGVKSRKSFFDLSNYESMRKIYADLEHVIHDFIEIIGKLSVDMRAFAQYVATQPHYGIGALVRNFVSGFVGLFGKVPSLLYKSLNLNEIRNGLHLIS